MKLGIINIFCLKGGGEAEVFVAISTRDAEMAGNIYIRALSSSCRFSIVQYLHYENNREALFKEVAWHGWASGAIIFTRR